MMMSEQEKDALIEAQKQVIGMLFEVVKRLQANSNLDSEYLQIISSGHTRDDNRLDDILSERQENAEIIGRLLKELDT